MKLLVVTQAVDRDSPTLGFFHTWISRLAPHYESVHVITLFEGVHDLPENVRVYSLGKEKGRKPRAVYSFRFLRLAWLLRHEYDAVFVHMNQEYVLLAGVLWKMLRKPIYMWRNHFAGSWRTDIAAAFCTKVFCTSRKSYTAKYSNTVLMPVGVDLERFHPDPAVSRRPHSILFLSRISPSKRPDVLIDALGELIKRNVSFTATIVGSSLPQDERYHENLKAQVERLGLHDRVRFVPGVPNEKTPALYQSHEIFVNCSPSGMFDKTLFEAAASGCVVLAQSSDFKELAGETVSFADAEEFATQLAKCLDESYSREDAAKALRAMVDANSLDALTNRLVTELT